MIRPLPALLAALLVVVCTMPVAQAQSATTAQQFGYAARKPVLGAACPGCPWGALADKVKAAMAPSGYDALICYNCSGVEGIRIVDDRKRPLPLTPQQATDRPRPPDAPVDFGVINMDFFTDAYRGIGRYGGEPHPDLRLLARIEDPQYYLVATRSDAFITDLAQIKEKHLPARIFTEDSVRCEMILKYYGLTEKDLTSWGGTFHAGRDAFDVVISFANSLNNTPESNIWYEASQRSNLRYLQLPDDLLQSLAKASDWRLAIRRCNCCAAWISRSRRSVPQAPSSTVKPICRTSLPMTLPRRWTSIKKC
jgi:hypothetical protein